MLIMESIWIQIQLGDNGLTKNHDRPDMHNDSAEILSILS